MSAQETKTQYRIRNWRDYDAALKKRGSLTFWIDDEVLMGWLNDQKTGKRGASRTYSDLAIATMSTMGSVLNLGGRQTEGFMESLFKLMGVELEVPDHSTISRRLRKLSVSLPVVKGEGACHVVVDATGVKVYGEGDWKVRQHGYSKRRTWRKLHLGVNEKTGEILAAVVSTNNVSDDEAFGDILDGIEEDIEAVSADGAYDKRKCYDAIDKRGAQAHIPPREDAQYWQKEGATHARNQNLQRIEEVGRAQWKQQSGYHRRSLAETAMFRFKVIFGNTCSRRTFDNQATELFLACAALNRMTHLGRPDSYPLTS
ncbi:MAG: IS5 family transposase [Cyanothece sp. SIO1E1]|nr:IS5 family transposase [Cyanothece sp. SIO1E1]